MLEPGSYRQLQEEIRKRMLADRALLDQLRNEIRPLRSHVRRIHPRSTTSISVVGTDGGNNRIRFDPYLVQIVRVVDSNDKEYCLEAVTPTTDVRELSRKQFDAEGGPATPLGSMMAYVGVRDLAQLSHMIRYVDANQPASASWVQAYRELVEWASLFSLVRNSNFGGDTLVIYDGLLRSKIFAGELFRRYLEGLSEGIERQFEHNRRRVYVVGVAKHSKVLDRYRLAMALEELLTTDYPAYVEIPREIEEKAYVRNEYARGDDLDLEDGKINKFVGGKMFFVKFGGGARDPIWPVDIYLPQRSEAQTILGCMLADSLEGFPIPFYPRSLQRAHENAALVDFDFDVLQGEILEGIRGSLDGSGSVLDDFLLRDVDPSLKRYGRR